MNGAHYNRRVRERGVNSFLVAALGRRGTLHMFSRAHGTPAIYPLPRRAAHKVKVTWRGRHVNILPSPMRQRRESESRPASPSFAPTGRRLAAALARQPATAQPQAVPGACRRPRHEPYPCQGGLTAGASSAAALRPDAPSRGRRTREESFLLYSLFAPAGRRRFSQHRKNARAPRLLRGCNELYFYRITARPRSPVTK